MKLLCFFVLQCTNVLCNINENDTYYKPNVWGDRRVTVLSNVLKNNDNYYWHSKGDSSDDSNTDIVVYNEEKDIYSYSKEEGSDDDSNKDDLQENKHINDNYRVLSESDEENDNDQSSIGKSLMDNTNSTDLHVKNSLVTDNGVEITNLTSNSNTTVTDSGIEPTHNNAVDLTQNGTDIFQFLENLFEKAQFPKAYDIPMLNRKIFRGARVSVTEHPYLVSIRREFSHYLTGTLLTRKVIITVAHPIYQVPITELRAVLGENYNDRGTILLSIILMIFHEDFDPNTLGADLALLVFYEEIAFRYNVKPIPIIPPRQIIEGETAFVTGWGRCDRTGKELCLPRSSRYFRNEIMDPMLRTIKFKINFTSCARDYRDKEIKFGMICAGDTRAEDLLCPCMAVPGAPLVVDASLAGIQSWGFGCGYIDDRPIVYTDIAAYQPWLIHNIPILISLSRNQVRPLLQATIANYYTRWLRHTRVSVPTVQKPLTSDIHPLNIDVTLAKLKGRIFDIRDFMFNYRYRKMKKLMYKGIKKRIKGEQNLKLYQINRMLRVNPFMDADVLNETSITLSNGSLVENGDSRKDSSNEELVSDGLTDSNTSVDILEMDNKLLYTTIVHDEDRPVIHF